MPAAVLTNAGRRKLAVQDFGPGTQVPFELLVGLYTNDVEPTADSVLSDFDPATFDGYAPILAPRASYALGSTPVDIVTVSQAGPLLFTAVSGSQLVYGGFVTTTDDGTLFGAVLFDAPVLVEAGVTRCNMFFGFFLPPSV